MWRVTSSERTCAARRRPSKPPAGGVDDQHVGPSAHGDQRLFRLGFDHRAMFERQFSRDTQGPDAPRRQRWTIRAPVTLRPGDRPFDDAETTAGTPRAGAVRR